MNKLTCCVAVVVAGITSTTSGATSAADAVFHLMQIEQVIGGVNGDTTVQAIQLRMRSTFQQFVGGARLRAWDAQGQNPVLLTDFGMNVAFGGAGRRVLITTANFFGVLDGLLAPDFIMANLIPASYLAAGSITFESDPFYGYDGTIWWRLSWGGAGYTGSTLGAGGVGANDADGDFGRWPGPLPSADVQALQFQRPATAQSTNNADDYALTAVPAMFTNNAGQTATLTPDSDDDGVPDDEDACPDSDLSETVIIDGCDSGVGNPLFEDGCTMADMIAECTDGAANHGQFVSCVALLTIEWRNAGLINGQEMGSIESCAAIPGDLDVDGAVGSADLLILLGAWGLCPAQPDACPADIDRDRSVGIADLLILLANWG